MHIVRLLGTVCQKTSFHKVICSAATYHRACAVEQMRPRLLDGLGISVHFRQMLHGHIRPDLERNALRDLFSLQHPGHVPDLFQRIVRATQNDHLNIGGPLIAHRRQGLVKFLLGDH